MSFPISRWYAIRLALYWSLAWSRKRVEPILINKTVRWQEIILLDSRKFLIYTFWSIFRVFVASSHTIYYLIIVLIFPQFFMLNFSMSWSFNHSNNLRLFDPTTKSFTYTPTIISSLFQLMVKMHISAFVEIKLIFKKNLAIVLF